MEVLYCALAKFHLFDEYRGGTMKTIIGIVALMVIASIAGCDGGTAGTEGLPVLRASNATIIATTDTGVRLQLTSVDTTVKSDDGLHSMPTDKFIAAYGFDEVLPSSATLYYGADRQSVDVLLTNQSYDTSNGILEFDVETADGSALPGEMDTIEVHLQSCADESYVCAWSDLTTCDEGIGPVGTCWHWIVLACTPCDCDKDIKRCTEANPHCCPAHGGCVPARYAPAPQGLDRFCL